MTHASFSSGWSLGDEGLSDSKVCWEHNYSQVLPVSPQFEWVN